MVSLLVRAIERLGAMIANCQFGTTDVPPLAYLIPLYPVLRYRRAPLPRGVGLETVTGAPGTPLIFRNASGHAYQRIADAFHHFRNLRPFDN